MEDSSRGTNESSATTGAVGSAKDESENAANGIEKPIDVRVMSEDDTNKSRPDDTNKGEQHDTNNPPPPPPPFASALRRLIGFGKRITATMKLTTYTVKGNKYFRYQETSAKLRKINPPVHLSPYVRRRGKDNLTHDDKSRIEAFKQTRANKRRRRKGAHPYHR